MKIRRTTDHKLVAALNEDVQNLHARLHPDRFKPFDKAAIENAISDFLKDPSCHCYVIEQDGEPAGYAIFFIRDIKANAFHHELRALHIDQIAVKPAYRGKGAGAMLLKKAEELAKEHGIIQVELDHWTSNHTAANYFRKNGYELSRERLSKVIDA